MDATRKPFGIGTGRLQRLIAAETATFTARTPKSRAAWERAKKSQPNGVPMAWFVGMYEHAPVFAAQGSGAYFEDIDGNRYLDMNLADLSASLGFAPPAIAEAVKTQADKGTGFLLPTRDGVVVTEALAARTGLPYWQFTGAASVSNVEAIRIARLATGRQKVLVFDGKYHGHIDDTLASLENGRVENVSLGLPAQAADNTLVVPFNDLDALAAGLSSGDVACVLAEPMLTNCNVVFPSDGFWPAAEALVEKAGALLVFDEAHTHSFAYGGLTTQWSLRPDIMVIGKGMGTGVAFSVYGVSKRLAVLMEEHLECESSGWHGLALGGTTFANALVLATARAALEHCLREEDYARTRELGERLGGGLQTLFDERGLAWRAPHIGGRSGWVLYPELPTNAGESSRSLDSEFVTARRLFMANRGVFEAISTAGPAASFAHTPADVDRYLEVSAEFLTAIV